MLNENGRKMNIIHGSTYDQINELHKNIHLAKTTKQILMELLFEAQISTVFYENYRKSTDCKHNVERNVKRQYCLSTTVAWREILMEGSREAISIKC